MSQPAARISDMHTCPMVTPGVPPVPHVGGPILPPGAVTTLIGGLPAARVGDMCVCVGPPDSIVKGSFTVLIGGKPAARMGDTTAHGGVIVAGFPKVMIGDQGKGQAGAPLAALVQQAGQQQAALRSAAGSGSAFCEVCERARHPVEAAFPGTAAQRNSLKEAARAGLPFCEECAHAAREAAGPVPALPDPDVENQRRVLQEAAAGGAAFCEECEKARTS